MSISHSSQRIFRSSSRSSSLPCLCYADHLFLEASAGRYLPIPIEVPYSSGCEAAIFQQQEQHILGSYNLRRPPSMPIITHEQFPSNVGTGTARLSMGAPLRYQRTRSFDSNYCPTAQMASASAMNFWQANAGASRKYTLSNASTMPYNSPNPYMTSGMCDEGYLASDHRIKQLIPPCIEPTNHDHIYGTATANTEHMQFYKPRPSGLYNYNANSFSGGLDSLNGAPNFMFARARAPYEPWHFDHRGTYGGGRRMAASDHCPHSTSASQGAYTEQTRMSSCGDDSSSSVLSASKGHPPARTRIFLVVCVFVIILAVLIAMSIAIYSQVRTQNSVVKVVRQYQGFVSMSAHQNSDFDVSLITPGSAVFKTKARALQDRFAAIMKGSVLSPVYEGCEVTSFKFVPNPPTLEAQFNLKTKVDADVSVKDLLIVLEDGIRNNVKGALLELKLDPGSLSIENQKLQAPKQTANNT